MSTQQDDGYTSETRPWRTLLRAILVTPTHVQVAIPAWDWDVPIALRLDSLPVELVALLAPDYLFYARVNIGAEFAADLRFSDFEWEGTLEEQRARIAEAKAKLERGEWDAT